MSESQPVTRRRRIVPLVWIGGAVAAALLILGVNGTLSSWTTAIIGNTNNTVAATHAVSLLETGPGAVTCDTSQAADNTATCSTINKYGGTSSPLDPDSTTGGDSQSVTVNLKNTGTGSGDLSLSADTCEHSADPAATNATLSNDVCSQITVHATCTAGSYDSGVVTLADFTGGPVATLAANDSTDCTFVLNLPAGTPSGYSGQIASQVLTWTLTAS